MQSRGATRMVYVRPVFPAWNVITVAARLAARLLEADYTEVDADTLVAEERRPLALLPRRRGNGTCIVVAPEPWAIKAVLHTAHWTRGYERTAAWVVDSWWDDRIPHVARTTHVDTIFVSERENLDVWERTTGSDVHWLPQGTDALGLGSASHHRPTDLLRVGRQPAEWDDDDTTAAAARSRGLSFAGRPPLSDDEPEEAMARLLSTYATTKLLLAFSNAYGTETYTHPSAEYLTGRWTDGLAAGATIAGIPPRCASAEVLLWPEATLDLGTTRLHEGLALIAAAARDWSPAVAEMNHRRALERLDWRWRIEALATTLGLRTPTLDAEMERLRTAVAGTRDGPATTGSAQHGDGKGV